MDWVEGKSVGLFLPAFAGELVGGETAEGLESFGEVVSGNEVAEVTQHAHSGSLSRGIQNQVIQGDSQWRVMLNKTVSGHHFSNSTLFRSCSCSNGARSVGELRAGSGRAGSSPALHPTAIGNADGITIGPVELRHLRYFTAVAESGGFGRAARLLHIAQSAISEQIHDLEAELGVELFDRNNRRVRLSDHGEQFLEDARGILRLADQAVANVKKSLRGEIGTLTIGFFVGGTGTFFPSLIKEFRRTLPDVQVSLVEMAPAMQHQALQAGTIDVAFTRAVQPVYASLLRWEFFETEPLYAVISRTHLLANKRRLFIRELSEERFVLNDRKYSPATFDKVITLCAEASFSPKISATATVSSGVIALVEAGEGVAILPQGSRILGSEGVVFIPLADRNAVIELVIAWPQQNERPVVRAFIDLVRRRRKAMREDGRRQLEDEASD